MREARVPRAKPDARTAPRPAPRGSAASSDRATLAGGPYSIAVVDRAIDVLQAFGGADPELTLARITQSCGLPKPTVFRLLKTLEARGLVAQRPDTGTYSLGYGLISLSELAKSRNGVVSAALPALRALRDDLDETAYLSVRVGDTRIDVEQVESLQSVRRVMSLGVPKELYAGCASRVLLAAMDDAAIHAYLERTRLVAFTKTTLTDRAKLLGTVTRTRRLGYAEGWDERNSGGAGVAAPIFGARNEVVAAIAVGAPTHRYDADLRQRAVHAVLAAAQSVSRALGQPAQRAAARSR
jgi:DNA-binding IclR family transcriptional regulator